MIKGVVFDMDGLMFDTEKIVFRNWSIVMKENNYDYNMDIYKKTLGFAMPKRKSFTGQFTARILTIRH